MSYTRLLYHIVFRSKRSVPAITEEHEEVLYRYVWGFVKSKDCVLYRIGGMPDHLHMLVQLTPMLSLSDFMRDLKTSTNKFLTFEHDKFPLFSGWGKSYFAMTCSGNDINGITEYIKGQKEHHKKVSFRDELLKLLEENGADVNIEYFMKD